MATCAVTIEAERPGLVEGGPQGDAVAERAENCIGKLKVVPNHSLAQPAAVTVLQHLYGKCH